MKHNEQLIGSERTRVLNARSHYETLDVPLRADEASIKARQRTLQRLFHPDVSGLKDAHDLMARVNGAYDVLMDKVERRKYDKVNKFDRVDVCTRCGGGGQIAETKGFKSTGRAVVCPKCNGTGF